MRKSKVFIVACSAIFFPSCGENDKKQIIIKNTTNSARSFETVSVDITSVKLADSNGDFLKSYAETKSQLVSQQIDSDGDGLLDVILFQPVVRVNSEKTYEINLINNTAPKDSIPPCYSRFMPEQTDDYDWENNRVAFRT